MTSSANNMPANWYTDAQGNLRWWDGQQWTAHVAPRTVQYNGGASSSSSSAATSSVVVVGGGKTGIGGWHVLHGFMTLLTCGLWIPIWIIHAASGGRTNGVTVVR